MNFNFLTIGVNFMVHSFQISHYHGFQPIDLLLLISRFSWAVLYTTPDHRGMVDHKQSIKDMSGFSINSLCLQCPQTIYVVWQIPSNANRYCMVKRLNCLLESGYCRIWIPGRIVFTFFFWKDCLMFNNESKYLNSIHINKIFSFISVHQ